MPRDMWEWLGAVLGILIILAKGLGMAMVGGI